jgi:hypothetical protein
MLRELLNKLSGRQLTAIILAAILVPGAVGAAVTFQPVAIVEPGSGRQSYIDGSRRLAVFDPIAGYRSNPANSVEISTSNYGSRCETYQQYKIPNGKSLVITAISGFERLYDKSSQSSGFYVYVGANCSGHILTAHYSSVSSASPSAPVAVDLGVGITVKSGSTVSVYSLNNYGYTFLHGYLVPASAVPITTTAEEAANESKPITAEEVTAKFKQFK